MDPILDVSAWVIPLVLSVMLHEVAHGWVAGRFGDDTARVMGRITLNPLKHIDRFGTIILPALLIMVGSPVVFGFAKPVPVNFNRLYPPDLGMRIVALAGPATNVMLALAVGLLMHIDHWWTPEQAPWLFANLYRALMINCVLAVFNMIPLLPLDGGRVLYSCLSGETKRAFGRMERYGLLLVFALLLIPQLLGLNLNAVLGLPVYWLMHWVMLLTGNTQ